MKKYQYIFTHKKTQAKLKFIAGEFNEAITLLSTLVNTVCEWDMKRFKFKK
jgi:hypothetical protein